MPNHTVESMLSSMPNRPGQSQVSQHNVASGPVSPMPIGGGGHTIGDAYANFQRSYQDVTNAYNQMNAGSSGSDQLGIVQGQSQGMPGMRQMNPWEQGISKLSSITQKAVDAFGFDPNNWKDPANYARFFASLPVQLASAIPEGFAGLTEAVTGAPVREANPDTGMISTEKLSIPKRAASGVNGLIDLIGIPAGGTGRIVGVAGEALSQGRRFGGMAEGWMPALANSKAFKTGISVAQGAAEEAGEEFTQSLLDDVRFDQLDEDSYKRAAQGAAWGALGGAGMAGIAAPIHMKLQERNAKNNEQQQPGGRLQQTTNYDEDYNALRKNPGNWRSNEIQEKCADQMKKWRMIPGSGVVKHAKSDSSLGMMYTDIGHENIAAVIKQGGRDAAVIAERLNTTTQNLIDAVYEPTKIVKADGTQCQTTTEALNTFLDAAGDVDIVIGRDPDTKNGAYKVRIRRFTDGQDISLPPALYTIVGSDVDGDTSGFYFDKDLNVNGYATELAMDPEGGSNIDWWFSGIHSKLFDTSEGSDAVDSAFKRSLGSYAETRDGKSFWEYHRDKFKDALSEKDPKKRNVALSRMFNDMRLDVESVSQDGMAGNLAFSDIVGDIAVSEGNTISKLKEIHGEMLDSKLVQLYEEKNPDSILDESGIRTLLRNGTLGNKITHPGEFVQLIGDMYYYLVDSGNPAYRKYGMFYYGAISDHASSFRDALQSATRFLEDTSVFDDLVRAEFRLVESGASPTFNIEGLIHMFVLTKTLYDTGFNENNRMKTQEDVDLLLETYLENLNEYSLKYNRASEQLMASGIEIPFDTIPKNGFKSTKDDGFMASFNLTFAKVPIRELVDETMLSEDVRVLSWGELVEMVAKKPGQFGGMFEAAGNKALQTLLNRSVSNYNSSEIAQSKRLRKDLGELPTDGVKARYEANGNHFDPSDMSVVSALMSFFNSVIDPNLCMIGGLLDPREAIKTKLGQMLYFGTREQKESAIVGYSMHWQFREILDAINGKDKQAKERAIWLLEDIREVSQLHAQIVWELTVEDESGEYRYKDQDGKVFSPTLRILEATNHDFTWKENEITTTLTGYSGDVFLDSLKTVMSSIDTVGGIGDTLRKAENHLNSAKKALLDTDIASIGKLENEMNATHIDDGQVKACLTDLATSAYTDIDAEIIGAQVWNALSLSNDFVEKAVIDDASSWLHASLQLQWNGSTSSFLEEITSVGTGDYTVDGFVTNRRLILQLFVNPDFTIDLFDPVSGKNITMTQKVLYEAAGVRDIGPNGPTGRQMLAVLKKYPVIAGYLCEGRPQPHLVNGTATATHARKRGIFEEFNRWRDARTQGRGTKDKLVGDEISRGVKLTSMWLWNQPGYKSYLVACAWERVKDSSSPRSITNAIVQTHNELCRQIYQGSQLPHFKGAGNGQTLLKKAVNDFFERTYSSTFKQVWSEMNAVFRRQQLDLAEATSAGFSEIIDFDKMFVDMAFTKNVNVILDTIEKRANTVISRYEAEESGTDSINVESLILEGGKVDLPRMETYIEKIFGNIHENIKEIEHLAIAQTIMYADVMARYSSAFDLSMTMIPDRRIIEAETAIIDAIELALRKDAEVRGDETYSGLDDETKAAISSHIRKSAEMFKGHSYLVDENGELLHDVNDYVFTDDDMGNEFSFRKKYLKLMEITGERVVREGSPQEMTTEDTIRSVWKDLNDPELSFEQRRDKQRSFRQLWRKKVVAHEMEQAARVTGWEGNANFHALQSDIFEFFDSVYSDGEDGLLGFLMENGGMYDSSQPITESFDGFKVPTGLANKTVQSIITNLTIMDSASGNPMAVNNNGGQNKHMQGYMYLPYATEEEVRPTPTSAAELLKRVNDDDDLVSERCKVLVNGEVTTIQAIMPELEALDGTPEASTTMYQFYDPEDNPHGITDPNTPAPFARQAREYHRASGIIARIIDESQEGMVLKKKKKFVIARAIVSKRKTWRDKNKTHIDPNVLDSPETAFPIVAGQFRQFRREYMREIAKNFRKGGDLEGLGFDDEQALIIAQMTTPGIKITIQDANGDFTKKLIDAKYVLEADGARFAAEWTRLVGDGVVVSAEPCTVPLAVGSYRIMDAITEEFRGQDNPPIDDVNATAARVMNDWSDMEFDSMTVDDVMYRIPPVGMAYNSQLVLTNARTPFQQLLDIEYPGYGASMNVYGKQPVSIEYMSENSSEYSQAKDVSKILGLDHRTDLVIHTWGAGELREDRNASWRLALKIGNSNSDIRTLEDMHITHMRKREACGVVFSTKESDIKSAVAWSREHDVPIYVLGSVKEKYRGFFRDQSMWESGSPKTIGDKQFIRIKPNQELLRTYNPDDYPTSSTTFLDPDDISTIVVDDFNLYTTADANILATQRARRFMVPMDDCPSYECTSLLPSVRSGHEFVSRADAVKLYEKLTTKRNGNSVMVEDDSVWKTLGFDFSYAQNKTTGLGKEKSTVKREIYRYLALAAEGKVNDNGIVKGGSSISSDQVAALISDGGMYRVAPVYTPKNAPRRIDYLNMYIIDGSVHIAYDGFVGLTDEFGRPRAKLASDGVSCKGIATPFDNSFLDPPSSFIPVTDPTTGSTTYMSMGEVEWIVNGDTIQSRATQRDHLILKNNLMHYLIKSGKSAFFETDQYGKPIVDDNGKPKWKARFLDVRNYEKCGITDENGMRAFNSALIKGDWEAWKYVASGDFTIFDDGYVNANRYVRDMAISSQRGYKVSLPKLLSAWGQGYDLKPHRFRSIEDYHMAFQHLDFNQTLELFHAIDQSICPDGQGLDGKDTKFDPKAFNTAFDTEGRYRVIIPNGRGSTKPAYMRVFIGRHDLMGDYSEASVPTGERSWGWQHSYRRGADNGVTSEDLQHAIMYSDMLLRNNRHMQVKSMLDWARDPSKFLRQRLRDDEATTMRRENSGGTFKEREHEMNVISVASTFRRTRKIKAGNEYLVNPASDSRISRELDKLRQYIPDITFEFAMQLMCNYDGYTYIDGSGLDWIDVDSFGRNIDAMCKSIEKHGLVVAVAEGGRNIDERYQIPLLDPYRTDVVWEHSEYIRSKFKDDKNAFIDAMKKEQEKAVSAIKVIDQSHLSKKRALELFAEWSYKQWNMPYATDYLYSGVYLDEMMKHATTLGSMLMKGERGWTQEQIDIYDECVERCQKQMSNARRQLDKAKGKVRANYTTPNGEIISETSKKDDGIILSKILNNLTELSKVMALLNPGVMIGNLIDRAVHQGIMNVSLKLGHEFHVGPYSGKRWINQDIVERAVNDPLFMRLYVAYRQAGFSGQELEFLSQAQDAEDIIAWLDNREKNMTRYQKAVSRIYDVSSGGNKMLKQQMRNFINRFVMFADSRGQDFWFNEGDGGVTYLEAQLASDRGAGRWFVDILGGNHAMTPSYDIALMAMNSAKAGDMAQRHVITEFYSQIARRSPLSKFFVTTTISRFPNYSINVTERMLNWILPMSSIRYVMTEKLAERHPDMNLENTQIHTGLREAMLVDITHLGVGAVAMILVGMSGALEPPDDEDKWGNTDEWTIFGLRVGEAWWIQDILGIALPLACFTKAAQKGNPRVDILSNGIAQTCYNNPIIRVSDAVGFFLDPEGSFVSDYNQDVINYAKAEGGPPGWMDWLQANATSFGLSWVSQFITPSVVREWYTNAQDYEASYKKIYKESPTGRINSEGLEGETQYTTYQDAMIRRTTRRNPVLGWLLDLVLQPETGYMWHEMPDTIYYDDAQIASMEKWSIDGLSDEDASAKLFEIIDVMQRYKSMEDLVETGFYLDPTTKAALSQQVWDNYHEIDEWWYGLQADGQLDYYALGNGDFSSGSKAFAELKQEYQKAKEYWSDFYYDKVRNLPSTMTMYRRYNTTYKRDANGDYYATGFRPTGVLPISSAPGRVSDPEGTAGRENDWATISAVTGQPMQQRALVPVESGYEDWPNLESWSGDGNGNGYSKMYQDRWGQGTTYSDTSSGSTGSGSGKKSSKRSGGGYRRSGGGRSYSRGGGGYTNISNPFGYSPSMPSPREMDRVNLQRTYLDYLRPGFETKGSREAYKREDI